MDTKRITSRQFFALTAFFTCGTSIIYVASTLASYAKQDAWISAAITPVFGMLFLWMYSSLAAFYPSKNLVEIVFTLLGKWFGGFTVAAFVVLCLVDVSQITWYIGNFITHTMPETPMLVINTIMLMAVVIALFYGVEAMARSSEILMPIISIAIILSLVLISPKIHADNIVPVFDNGIGSILKGSFLLLSYTTWPLIVLNMIYPSLTDDIKKARKSGLLGYLWGSSIIFLITIITILVIGSSVAGTSSFPFYLLAREIEVGSFISRMEAVISIVWIITLYFKALLYFYGGIISLSQLLRLKDHKRIILPMGLLLLMLSLVVYPNSIYEAQWDKTTWIPFIATFSVALPGLLLILTAINRHSANKQ